MPSRLLQYLLYVASTAAMSVGLISAAHAAEPWPTRPIKLVVPFSAGGSNDVIARRLADRLTQNTGQTVIVENRGGAGGVVGANAVATAQPDGYTFLFSSGSIATSAAVQKTPYDVERAFEAVSRVATAPFVILVRQDLPVKNVAELVAYARANPGVLNYGSAGLGDSTQMATELFKSAAGIDVQQVGYNGIAPAQLDLLAGRLDMVITTVASIKGTSADQLPKLAFTTAQRDPEYPQVPTVREAGIDYVVEVWWGVFAPAGVPANIRDQLNKEIARVVAEPAFAQFLKTAGAQATPSTPQALQTTLSEDFKTWSDVATRVGISQR